MAKKIPIRRILPNKAHADSGLGDAPSAPDEAVSSDSGWIWITIVCCFLFLPPVFRRISRLVARRHIFSDEHLGPGFEPCVIAYDCSYDADDCTKAKRYMYMVLSVLAGMAIASFFGFASAGVLTMSLLIGLPIAFLFWRDSKRVPPLKSVSFSTESVVFELADGRRSNFPLNSGTDVRLSVYPHGGDYLMSATFYKEDEMAEVELNAGFAVNFAKVCFERGVEISLGDDAPAWLRKGFMAMPWWR